MEQRIHSSFTQIGGENRPQPWQEREPFKLIEVIGIEIQVQCPNCGEYCKKIVYKDELSQDLERGLCPRCHKERGIRVPEIVAELRTLL